MTDFTHLMFWVLVGHFVGDYLLQSKRMALTKSAPGWTGLGVCLDHCLWYTIAVGSAAFFAMGGNSLVLGPDSTVLTLLVIFVTHFPIDRWSLADKWLKMIHGRQLDEVFKETSTNDVPSIAWRGTEYLLADKTNVADVATRQAFTALVYAVVDNTLHFLLMTAGFAALLHWGVLS